MADNDLELRIKTTADTSGVEQVRQAVRNLQSDTGPGGGSAMEARIRASHPELFEPSGGAFGGGSAGYTGLTAAAANAERHTLAVGINLTRARQEAIILARELATGVPTTRTLSSLLGSLGISIGAAAVAGFALNRAIVNYGEQQVKINNETDAFLGKLIRSTKEWAEMAKAATSMEDVGKIAGSVIPAVEEAGAKVRVLQMEQQSYFQQLSDFFVKAAAASVGGKAEGFFKNAHDKAMARAQQQKEETEEAGGRAIDLAKKYADAFDKEKVEDVNAAIAETVNKISELTDKQNHLSRWSGTYAEDWHRIQGEINIATGNLDKLLALDTKRAAAEAAHAKQVAHDIREGPISFQNEFIEKQKEQMAMQAAARSELRQMAAEGGPHTPAELARQRELQRATGEGNKRFQLEIEREALMRQQTLADTLIPEGGENLLSNYLGRGRQEEAQYRARQERLRQIDAQMRGMDVTGGKLDAGSTAIVAAIEKLAALWR